MWLTPDIDLGKTSHATRLDNCWIAFVFGLRVHKKTGENAAGTVQSEIYGQLKALDPGLVSGDLFPVVIKQVPPIS